MNLWINGKAVELKSTSFQTVINSGLFSDEPLVGNYTYPFTIPFSEVNEEIFSFSHLPEVRTGLVKEFSFLLEDGIYVISGTCILLDSSRKTGFKVSLISGASTIVSKLKTTSMYDINMGNPIRLFANTDPIETPPEFDTLFNKPYVVLSPKKLGEAEPNTSPDLYDFLWVNLKIKNPGNINITKQVWYGVPREASFSVTIQNLANRINANQSVPNWLSTEQYYNINSSVYHNTASFVKHATKTWLAVVENINKEPGYGNILIWNPIDLITSESDGWELYGITHNALRYDCPWDDKKFYAIADGNNLIVFYLGSGNWLFDSESLTNPNRSTSIIGYNYVNVSLSPQLDAYTRSTISTFSIARSGIYKNSEDVNLFPTGEYAEIIFNKAASEGYEKHDFAIFPVKNDGINILLESEFETFPFDGIVNSHDGSKFRVNHKFSFDGKTQIFTPFPYLLKILKYVFRNNGWDSSGSNVFDDDFLKKICIYNNRIMDCIFDPFELELGSENFLEFNLTDHLPNLSVYDLFSVFKKYYFGAIFYNPDIDNQPKISTYNSIIEDNDYFDDWTDIVVSINYIKPPKNDGATFSYSIDSTDKYFSENVKSLSEYVLKESVPTIGDLPAIEQNKSVRYVVSEDSYYLIVNNVWQFLSLNILPYVLGSGVRKNTPKADTSAMFNSTVPIVRQEGYSDKLLKRDVVSSLRFLQYNGLQYTGPSYFLPTASNEGLLFHGENGIYNQRAKKFNEFLDQTQQVEVTLNMDNYRAKLIRTNKKVRIDGCAYLVESITLQNPMPSLAKALIYLVP